MKKILFIICLSLFFGGCANNEPNTPSTYNEEPTALDKTLDGAKVVGEKTFDVLNFFVQGGMLDIIE